MKDCGFHVAGWISICIKNMQRVYLCLNHLFKLSSIRFEMGVYWKNFGFVM